MELKIVVGFDSGLMVGKESGFVIWTVTGIMGAVWYLLEKINTEKYGRLGRAEDFDLEV